MKSNHDAVRFLRGLQIQSPMPSRKQVGLLIPLSPRLQWLMHRDDLDDDEKQLLHASQDNLRFLRALLLFDVIPLPFNCISEYICKLEAFLFGFWTGREGIFCSLFCTKGNFQDPSSQVIKQVKFQLTKLNTSLHISGIKRERLTFMEDGYLEDEVLIMSQIEALPCDALSFFKLLNEHENEKDDCKEIDVAFLKWIGTTKLIQAVLVG